MTYLERHRWTGRKVYAVLSQHLNVNFHFEVRWNGISHVNARYTENCIAPWPLDETTSCCRTEKVHGCYNLGDIWVVVFSLHFILKSRMDIHEKSIGSLSKKKRSKTFIRWQYGIVSFHYWAHNPIQAGSLHIVRSINQSTNCGLPRSGSKSCSEQKPPS